MKTQAIANKKENVIKLFTEHNYIILVIFFGLFLTFFLSDKIFPYDASSWFKNAVNLYEKGETGYQFRNILYGYFLSIPLFLRIDPTIFGSLLSQLSLLLSALILYKINIRSGNKIISSFVSLVFIISFPILRHGTQIYSDIPAALFIVSAIFYTLLVFDEKKYSVIPLVYLFASLSVSLRYSSAFYFPAFLYFVWVTRGHYKLHILGIALSVIPFIPQLIYNFNHLEHIYSISYSSRQPTLGFQYFFKELKYGYRFQLFHYLQFIFFHFRGVFVLFLPIIAFGLYYSFKEPDRFFVKYLFIFFISFIVLLSFFVAFDNRYAIPALLPCYIWFNLGMREIYRLAGKSKVKRILFFTWIVIAVYINFEISFHIIQSSKAIHKARYKLFRKLNTILDDGDVVITGEDLAVYDSRIKNISIENKNIIKINTYDYLLINEKVQTSNNVYLAFPACRWYSEGKKVNYPMVRDSAYTYTVIDSFISGNIKELLFYKILRLMNKSNFIPQEEWILYKVSRF